MLTADIASVQYDVMAPFDFVEYAVSAAYEITPEFMFGAGFKGIDGDVPAWDGYEVFGQYQNEQFAVALNYTQVDDDDAITALYAEYAVSPEITVGLDVQSYSYLDTLHTKLSAAYDAGPIHARGYYQDGSIWIDRSLVGARGSYDINDAFRVSAGAEVLLDNGFDATTYAVGAGYQVADGVWFDASAGQILTETTDITRIQAMISFETGAQTRVDQRFLQRNRGDRFASIESVYPF
ncbi:TonB dependent receptor [Yoonia tamlensis]|uniref:TonB dependent receptor n=1 Tax=Yoonia tamlensis TaxID=390270 RepID=A0A1I6HGF2_9RHOB|nr:TonB dependent receptor [Yoonia tamlensis]